MDEIIKELNRRLEPEGREFGGMLNTISAIRCADGLKMSVQASRFHYCEPRDNTGPWYKVEIGFPSQKVDVLLPYAEEPDKPTSTVYGYVPIKLVAMVIADHGGFAEETKP